MKKAIPLVLVAFAIGCGGDFSGKPIDPNLYQVTVEVRGMT